MSIISFENNFGLIFERRGLHVILWSLCTHHEHLTLHNSAGEVLTVKYLPSILYGHRSYNRHRGELHEALYYYAKAIGVDIRLGQDVTEYWEDKENSVAGVVTNGKRLSADVVIGADGVRSKARTLVLGMVGYGVDKDPLTDYLVKNGDAFHGWIGPDVHLLVSSSKNGRALSWVITHKDEADIEESWSFPGKMDVLKVEGWDPRCAAIITKTPSCVDLSRPVATMDQQMCTTRAHRRRCTSFPSDKNPRSLPNNRVRRAQLIGESTRDMWHKARPEAKGKEAEPPRPKWLLGFDAEKHAYGMYEEIAKEIKEKGYRPPILPPREPVEEETGN
ncbi:hypothetical protein ACEPAF_7187 [Sanghuangporus sanghuang]